MAPRRIPIRRLRSLPAALGLAALLGMTPRTGSADPASIPPAPERAIYRIDPGATKSLRPLLELGFDVAGRGPGGTWELLLTRVERDQVRALGFDPVPIELLPYGRAATSPLLQPNLGAYHNYAEAQAEMAAYVAAHPAIARLDTIGLSLEGRVIEAVKVSDQVNLDEAEPEVLVVGCHHARELMSVELPLYLLRRLLDGYGSDPVLTSLVDTREIWIVPVANPDGYVYLQEHATGQSGGWWRKNRRLNGDGSIGVDLNRNYGYRWGWDDLGSSPNPPSETYRGTGPFSEPETAAIRDFAADRSFTIAASFHSYGELFLFPWGYGPLDTPDHAVFAALGDSVAIQNGYLAGNPKSGAIYLTNGDLDDWAYGETSAKPPFYSFTFELNTSAQGGFAPPDNLIGPTCELNWGPLLTLLRYADQPRRILPPARTTAPTFVSVPGELDIQWTVPAADPANPSVRHDVRRIDTLVVGPDDAEAGVGAWDSVLFAWSATRHASGTRSFWSGSGSNRESILTSRAGVDAAAGESLVVQAYWDLEPFYDWWYAEASEDGGVTWTSLAGDRTTNVDPFDQNEGNGITETSGGGFSRAAFAWGPFAGDQVRVRFRCVTDGSTAGEGLYLDDLAPVAFESGITDINTFSADHAYALVPRPGAVTWFEVRAVDSELQAGPWSPRSQFVPDVTGAEPPAVVASPKDRLESVEPNPFNPHTRIRFALGAGRAGAYRLEIFDLSGRLVAQVDRGWDAGLGAPRVTAWSGLDRAGHPVGSGVYLLRLESVRGATARKITLLR